MYTKIRIFPVTKDENSPEGETKMISITKSKSFVLEDLEPYGRIRFAKINSLQQEDEGQLVGSEILTVISSLVACTARKCVVVKYDSDLPQERVIRLGETATSIFINKNYAFIGVADSSKNTVAFYPISELIWPRNDPLVEELNPYDLKKEKRIVKCNPDYNLVPTIQNGTTCFCRDGSYLDVETGLCKPCG